MIRRALPIFIFLFAAILPSYAQIFGLKRLLIAESEEAVLALADDVGDGAQVYVEGVPALLEGEFNAKVEPLLGRAIDGDLLNEIATIIRDHARENDRLLVKISPPTQNIATGVFRMAVIVGRYNELQFDGNRWFSDELLQNRLGIRPGDEILVSELQSAIEWANTNPFRQIKVLVNDLEAQPGKADLIVGVQERLPWRFAGSYADDGVAIIGKNRYTASIQFGNLFGKDHQGSYQYTTTDNRSLFEGHTLNYQIPLPWRHKLSATGAYFTANPVFGGGAFSQEGKTILGNLNYSVPLQHGDEPREIFAGIDFKRTNNNLEFGGTSVRNTETDTIQAKLGFSTVKRDKLGSWILGSNLNWSPGGIGSRNSDTAFAVSRPTSRSSYLYGTLSLQRVTKLLHGWQLFNRAYVQLTDTNLLPGEQLSIGGSRSVRGFDERLFSGDNGFLLSMELQSPLASRRVSLSESNAVTLSAQIVAFWDSARVYYKKRAIEDLDLPKLETVGLGLRCKINNNLSFNADYGWRISDQLARNPQDSGGHVRLVVAY